MLPNLKLKWSTNTKNKKQLNQIDYYFPFTLQLGSTFPNRGLVSTVDMTMTHVDRGRKSIIVYLFPLFLIIQILVPLFFPFNWLAIRNSVESTAILIIQHLTNEFN